MTYYNLAETWQLETSRYKADSETLADVFVICDNTFYVSFG